MAEDIDKQILTVEDYFNNDEFMFVYDAFEYLDEYMAVTKLDKLFFYFKGFADGWNPIERAENDGDKVSNDEALDVEEETHEYESVYLDGICSIELEDGDAEFWSDFLDKGSCSVDCILFEEGKINGRKGTANDFEFFTVARDEIDFEEFPLYVRKKELDEMSERFGIPKKEKREETSFDTEVDNLNIKKETTYLRIICALLDCIDGKIQGVEKHPSIRNQAHLISIISEHYQGYYGLSESNLSRKFPEAIKSIS